MMPPALASFLCTMLVSSNIWTAYGIRTSRPETFEMQSLVCILSDSTATPTKPSSQNHLAQRETHAQPMLARDSNVPPSPALSSPPATLPATLPAQTSTTHPTTTFEPAAPAATDAAYTHTPPHLSPAAIAGLCISTAVLIVLTAYLVLEVCVFRRRRRARALRRAVEEVERGSIRSDSVRSEVKSRGCVVDEMEMEDEEGWGEGRKGLSLPRRMW
jgi:hypothetical protein